MLAVGLVVLVGAGAASWWFGRRRALQSLPFVDVSASTAAAARNDDHFYSDYGNKIPSSTVSSRPSRAISVAT